MKQVWELLLLKSCFFIGHHTAPNDIHERLLETIERHITKYGVTEFIVGRYGAFDRMVQSALVKAKERYPHIILRLLITYHPAEQPIIPPRGFDGTYYPTWAGERSPPLRYRPGKSVHD